VGRAHAGGSDEVRVARLLHDLGGSRGAHDLHGLFLRGLNELPVVVVKVEADVGDGEAEQRSILSWKSDW